jgi:putative tryptophan/tyrosine transport system substrate-binding protein
MNRRTVITLLGGAAAWPLVARAQQAAMPVIGFLSSELPSQSVHLLDSFRSGLSEAGFVEHRNVGIEYRWAEGRYDRLPALAADLVKRQVAVIAATSGSVLAAKAATASLPIIFVTGSDPVERGIIDSLARPGGNLTGVMIFTVVLAAKRVELLRELLPKAKVIGMLVNPNNINSDLQLRDGAEAARALDLQVRVAKAVNEPDLDGAFSSFVQSRVDAALILPDPFFNSRRQQIVALASRHTLPAIYGLAEYVEDGGLMSYGTSRDDAYRLAGLYTGHVLKGAKPADLPVVQPTKFELVINLKTAKALGLEIPPTLLARADEVIE